MRFQQMHNMDKIASRQIEISDNFLTNKFNILFDLNYKRIDVHIFTESATIRMWRISFKR